MRHASRLEPSHVISWLLTVTAPAALLTVPVAADQAQSVVGAQSRDGGKQALAFLPNELWVHAGDSITWTFDTDEKMIYEDISPL
jgi:plastocyanin